MSASPELPVINCPSGLVASCAPLLGYEPEESIVGFIGGVPRRTGVVVVRSDLAVGEAAGEAAERLARSIAGTNGTDVDVVAWVDAGDYTPSSLLSSGPMLAQLGAALRARGLTTRTVLSTNGSVWWTHECAGACCQSSVLVDPSVVARVRAEYAYAGYAPLANRQALVERLLNDDERVPVVRRSLDSARPPGNAERWRDAQVAFLTGLLLPGGGLGTGSRATGVRTRLGTGPIPAPMAARSLRGLADVAVRDTVLLRLIACKEPDREHWHRTIDVLCDVVRCAPKGRAAPAATLLGIVAWMCGEGALATVALDRADEDNCWYRLAGLARQVIERGIDPEQWRDGMSGLTEAQCRGAGGSGAGA